MIDTETLEALSEVDPEVLRALKEVPVTLLQALEPEVLRALAAVPPEVLRALRDVPRSRLEGLRPEALQALAGVGSAASPSGSRKEGEGRVGEIPEGDAGELHLASERLSELLKRSGHNVLGCLGAYRGHWWLNVAIDSGGGPISRLLELPDYKVAQVFAVLGSEVRLGILRRLLEAPKTASELVAELRLGTTGQAYHHLRELERAGAVEAREGRYHLRRSFIHIYLTAFILAHDLGAETPEEEGLEQIGETARQ